MKEEIERIQIEEKIKNEAAQKVFEDQFEEMNHKVMDAKKELAVERLRREEETAQYEQRVTLLESERLHFHEEKSKIEEAAKRVNQ